MHRSLIIAKIAPGADADVARVFAESDRTELPHIAAVRHRSLYRLGEVYVHMLETSVPADVALSGAREHPEFARVSAELQPYISPLLPTWRGPRDAVATRFYSWDAPASAGEAR